MYGYAPYLGPTGYSTPSPLVQSEFHPYDIYGSLPTTGAPLLSAPLSTPYYSAADANYYSSFAAPTYPAAYSDFYPGAAYYRPRPTPAAAAPPAVRREPKIRDYALPRGYKSPYTGKTQYARSPYYGPDMAKPSRPLAITEAPAPMKAVAPPPPAYEEVCDDQYWPLKGEPLPRRTQRAGAGYAPRQPPYSAPAQQQVPQQGSRDIGAWTAPSTATAGAPVPPLTRQPYISPVPPGTSTLDDYDDDFICGTLTVTIDRCIDLPNMDASNRFTAMLDKTDAYVRIKVNDRKGPCTRTIRNDNSPRFNETFVLHLAGKVDKVQFFVKDADNTSAADNVGQAELRPADFIRVNPPQMQSRTIPLTGCDPSPKTPYIVLNYSFLPASAEIKSSAVIPSAFPQKQNCRLTMYQDAHVYDNQLPAVPIAGGRAYKNGKCWLDLYNTICQAKHFIYITGWSVWAELKLQREVGNEETLGELLKRKANEPGMTVLIMVWDDATSHSLFHKAGLMGTWDEITHKYFRGSKVVCEKVDRKTAGYDYEGQFAEGNATGWSKLMGGFASGVGAGFTHHQKSVICDAPYEADPSRRRVVAFVGGLDLTSGRYDNPDHPIFSTLDTIKHKADFYNGFHPTFDAKFGPREPWHDIHSKVEGPAARDVFENFRRRWFTQVHHIDHDRRKFKDIKDIPEIIPENLDIQRPDGTSNTWKIQLFRSIDSKADNTVKELRKLSGQLELDVEQGIHEAYIHAIRRAQRFIYVENQYFLGSSFEWYDEEKLGLENVQCPHRIPYELAMRAVAKIRKGQRFSIYICIPISPEGVVETGTIQGILHWQWKTIDMMYRKIAEAIQAYKQSHPNSGFDAVPTDYLNVYCPGKRERAPQLSSEPADAAQKEMRRNNRHPIYVHSKMLICDDEYIIIGSANINQRSMAGNRDSEIAIGAIEDGQTAENMQRPQGQVSGFRQSVWAEHLGRWIPEFAAPDDLACVWKINAMADANWEAYNDPTYRDLPYGHWMRYPYTVDARTGMVINKVPVFPDSTGKVCGTLDMNTQLLTT